MYFTIVFKCIFLLKMLLKQLCNSMLNGLLKEASRGWIRLVQTGGTLTNSVFFFLSRVLTPSVWCAQCTSVTKFFPVEPVVGGFIKMFPHCSDINFFIIDWSPQAFGWNAACTLRSQASCSLWVVLRPFPQSITSEQRRGTPSANIVGCTLHCHLSIPEDPDTHYTSLLPLSA